MSREEDWDTMMRCGTAEVIQDELIVDVDHMRTRCTVCGECTVCNLRPCRDGGPHKPNKEEVN